MNKVIQDLSNSIPLCYEKSNLDNLNINWNKYSKHYNFLSNELFPYLKEIGNIHWNVRAQNRMGFWIDSCQGGNKFISLDFLIRKHKLKFCFFHGSNRDRFIEELQKIYSYKIITDKADNNIYMVYFNNLLLNDDMKDFISDSYTKKIKTI